MDHRISHEGIVSVGGNYYSVPGVTCRRVVEVHSLVDEIRIFEDDRLIPCWRDGGNVRFSMGTVVISAGMTASYRRMERVARLSLDIYAAIGQQLAGARA